MGRVGLGFRKRFAKVECDEPTQILTLNCYVSARRGSCRSGFSGISQLIILENFTVFPTHFNVKWAFSHFGANREVARRLTWKKRNLGSCRSGLYERAKEITPPSKAFMQGTEYNPDLHDPKITGVRPFANRSARLRAFCGKCRGGIREKIKQGVSLAIQVLRCVLGYRPTRPYRVSTAYGQKRVRRGSDAQEGFTPLWQCR